MGIRSLKTASIAAGVKRSKIWDQSATIATDFEAIGFQTVTSNTATVTFTSVPTAYASLQLRVFARKDTGGNDGLSLYFNNDLTNSNYAYHCMLGDGTSTTQTSNSRPDMGSIRDNAWNTTVINIPDYLNTSKTKVRQGLSGSIAPSSQGSVFYHGGVWNNTAAVNRIDLKTFGGNNFIPGSVFALYGLRG